MRATTDSTPRCLSADALRRMTQVDYQRHLAFVITTFDAGHEIVVAEARYAVDDDGDGAEFALVVNDHWQRNGLGKRAMHALSAATRAGLRWLHDSVLSSNAPMLSPMQHCRFRCTLDRVDARLVHVEARLC